MGEFRIGRSRAQHSYPDTRGAGVAGFARNSAFGPSPQTPLAIAALGTKIPWVAPEVGTAGSTIVPITPNVTGIVRVLADVVVENTAGVVNNMLVELFVNGVTSGPVVVSVSTIPAKIENDSGFITIPFEFDFAGANKLTLGTLYKMEIKVTPMQGGTSTKVDYASIDIQELPAATG